MQMFRTVYRSALALCLAAFAAVAVAQTAPDVLVKNVSQEVLGIIKADPKVQAGDQARIREVVETKLLPYFDFERITALEHPRFIMQYKAKSVDAYVRKYVGALEQV